MLPKKVMIYWHHMRIDDVNIQTSKSVSRWVKSLFKFGNKLCLGWKRAHALLYLGLKTSDSWQSQKWSPTWSRRVCTLQIKALWQWLEFFNPRHCWLRTCLHLEHTLFPTVNGNCLNSDISTQWKQWLHGKTTFQSYLKTSVYKRVSISPFDVRLGAKV